jgi:hypothetical protein
MVIGQKAPAGGKPVLYSRFPAGGWHYLALGPDSALGRSD